MNGTRVEQLISKKITPTAWMLRLLGILTTCVASVVVIGLLGALGFVLIFFAVYSVIYLFKMTDVEYEYLLFDNELSIDAIYGKSKRKGLISVNVHEAEIFAPVNSDRVHNYLANEKILARDYTSGESENVYLLVINSGNYMYKIFLEPNEKLFEGIKHIIPRKTYTE